MKLGDLCREAVRTRSPELVTRFVDAMRARGQSYADIALAARDWSGVSAAKWEDLLEAADEPHDLDMREETRGKA